MAMPNQRPKCVYVCMVVVVVVMGEKDVDGGGEDGSKIIGFKTL